MKRTNVFLCITAFLALSIVSCKKETNSPEENDNELITTVEVHLTEQGTTDTKTFKWGDADGIGGNDPIIQTITLEAGKKYDAELVLLDETKSPVENTTEEIAEENEDHRFYFTPSSDLGLVIDAFDEDDAGLPLGIKSVWSAGVAANGSVRVVLRHYPSGGKDLTDPVSSNKSSTDADVSFPVEIK